VGIGIPIPIPFPIRIGIGIAAGWALISHTSNVAGTGHEFPLQPPVEAFLSLPLVCPGCG